MRIVKTKKELAQEVQSVKSEKKKIGFVPTMGCLHEGHLSIFRESKKQTDFTIASIFVNPTQFNDPKDFEKYPKTINEDVLKSSTVGVDLLYIPETIEMYPFGLPNFEMKIPKLMDCLCAKSRPGHFDGVMLVVSKLFHHVNPEVAFFGKKDYQQFLIVKEMVQLLDFPIEIVGVETLRENDGLAMSSRNTRLNPEERSAASLIPRSLKIIEKEILNGERNPNTIREIVQDILMSSNLIRIDYVEVVDPDTLANLDRVEKNALVAIAAFSGDVRLIDNIVIRL